MMKTLPHKDDPLLRLNAVCPYFTIFPLQFPFNRLAKAKPGQVVLEPFCGRGTTLSDWHDTDVLTALRGRDVKSCVPRADPTMTLTRSRGRVSAKVDVV